MLFEGFMKPNEPKRAAEVKEEFQRRFIKCAVKFSAIQAKWESLENEVESVGLHTYPYHSVTLQLPGRRFGVRGRGLADESGYLAMVDSGRQ